MMLLPQSQSEYEPGTVISEDRIRQELANFGINFENPDYKSLLPLDPDKVYILTLGGDTPDDLMRTLLERLHIFFKDGKGEMIMIRGGKIGLKDYSIEDLKVIREYIDRLIRGVEKKNLVIMSRYDILKKQD